MRSPKPARTKHLSSHIAGHDARLLPNDVIHAAKLSLLDGLGVSLAASALSESAQPFISLARTAQLPVGTPILGAGFSAAPSVAAMANGALAHALDFEDTHDAAIVHPYAAAIPAALSALTSPGARKTSGRDFLASIAHGANLVCRVSLGFVESPETNKWFLHPVLNSFGAAAAASRILGSSAIETENALSLAFSQSTSSAAAKSAPRTDYRAIREGFNAHAGFTGAMLARSGLIGFAGVFDPPFGINNLYGDGQVDESALLGDLDSRWENLAVSFKPWPACRGSHAFIDCALQIKDNPMLDASRIASIELTVSPFYHPLCTPLGEKAHPETGPEAKFSIPFVVATALLRGKVALADFSTEALLRTDVSDLAMKVKVTVDNSLDLRTSMTGGLRVINDAGAIFEAHVSHPRGSPQNPLGDADLMVKFQECVALADRPPASVDRLADIIMHLELEGDASRLLAALQ